MSDKFAENPQLITISNQQGMTVTLMDWGATIISLKVPVFGEKESREMLLGVKDPARWHEQSCFFNATIGRYANRIAHNSITLGGKEYRLTSDGVHTLHGGVEGFDKRRFQVLDHSANSVTYVLHSDHLDMGFPGNFELTVTYRVEENQTLYVHYLGKCDEECYACITNHAYFNLNGHNSSILGHTLWLDANEYLPLDADSIPVGEVRSVHGTTFDFTTPKTIGQDFLGDEQQRLSLGYDHPFLIKGDPLSPFAAVTSEDGRVKMQMFTDYPAVQFYSGNYLNLQHAKVIARDDGKIYFNQSGFCLEPEYYPDSPHLSEFAVLNPTVTPQRPLDHFIAWQFDV